MKQKKKIVFVLIVAVVALFGYLFVKNRWFDDFSKSRNNNFQHSGFQGPESKPEAAGPQTPPPGK